MGTHGPHYDEFTAQSGEHRGGALFDEHHGGPSAKAGSDAVTQTYRETTANGSGHGARWDEFDWKQMPEHYGRHFDSDFRQTADIPHGHGTWQDIFRGGTEVRADVNGIPNVEAVVLECHGDHAVLELKGKGRNDGGGRVEVNLGQIKEWRAATAQGQASETRKPAASPGNTPARMTASTAEAPSATNRKARGGGRTELDPEAATGSVFTTVKTADGELDVQKMAMADFHTHSCSQCKQPYHITPRGTVHAIKSASHGGTLIGKAVTGCQTKSCTTTFKNGRGTLARGVFTKVGKTEDAPEVDVAKTLSDLRAAAGLDVTKTAKDGYDLKPGVTLGGVAKTPQCPSCGPKQGGHVLTHSGAIHCSTCDKHLGREV